MGRNVLVPEELKMIRLIGTCVGLLLACTAAYSESFEYVSPLDSRASITIDTNIPSVSIGDVTEPAKICANTVELICITSKTMTFAVPRDVGDQRRNWEYAGHRFAISVVSDFAALGFRESNVLHVTSVDGERKFSFLYSPRVGLIAIRVVSPAGTILYLATTQTGFGVSGAARQSTDSAAVSAPPSKGSNYNYFRDYDPSIGRYVESDPIGLKGGPNTYSYVGAHPLQLVDRMGREPGNMYQRGYGLPMPDFGAEPGLISFPPKPPLRDPCRTLSPGLAAGGPMIVLGGAGFITGGLLGTGIGVKEGAEFGAAAGLIIADSAFNGAIAGGVIGAAIGGAVGTGLVIYLHYHSNPNECVCRAR